jgi:hypothetical protein
MSTASVAGNITGISAAYALTRHAVVAVLDNFWRIYVNPTKSDIH